MAIEITGVSGNTWFAIGLLALWELIWKGFALWRAGRRNQPVWFVCLLLINSLGILPIIYLQLTKGKADGRSEKSS